MIVFDSVTTTTVPVLSSFGGEVIGELKIRTDALPPSPLFSFGVAYELCNWPSPGAYKLCAVAVVPTQLIKGS